MKLNTIKTTIQRKQVLQKPREEGREVWKALTKKNPVVKTEHYLSLNQWEVFIKAIFIPLSGPLGGVWEDALTGNFWTFKDHQRLFLAIWYDTVNNTLRGLQPSREH